MEQQQQPIFEANNNINNRKKNTEYIFPNIFLGIEEGKMRSNQGVG